MPRHAPTRNARSEDRLATMAREAADEIPRVTQEVADNVTEYVRRKPGTAMLCCLGIGFVLGWKLKPW